MTKETFIVVMPVYNEEGCIEKVVNSWIGLIKNFPGSEILVVNDGSKDRTKEKLDKLKNKFKELRVVHKENGGHGSAIIRGYGEAVKTKHNWIFQTDSDNQHSPKDFNKLWSIRHASNFILGYRLKRNDSLHRILIAKLILLLNIILFGKIIKDPNVPYRLMKREYLEKLLNAIPKNVFLPNMFLTILAIKDHQNVMDIPISHKERKTGKVSLIKWKLVKACLRGFKELVLFRLNLSRIMEQLKEYH